MARTVSVIIAEIKELTFQEHTQIVIAAAKQPIQKECILIDKLREVRDNQGGLTKEKVYQILEELQIKVEN